MQRRTQDECGGAAATVTATSAYGRLVSARRRARSTSKFFFLLQALSKGAVEYERPMKECIQVAFPCNSCSCCLKPRAFAFADVGVVAAEKAVVNTAPIVPRKG